jgi:hypothetical protein
VSLPTPADVDDGDILTNVNNTQDWATTLSTPRLDNGPSELEGQMGARSYGLFSRVLYGLSTRMSKSNWATC